MFNICKKLYNRTILEHLLTLHRVQLQRCLVLPCSNLITKPTNILVPQIRYKYSKRKSAKTESESDEEQDYIHEILDKNTKILSFSVTSLRVDGILKNSLGLSRAKIETIFYESKIRINGRKLLKKSLAVHEGDEIDVIKGPNLKNPDFITVARIEILSVKAKEETISVTVKRCKSLSVEAYD